MIANHLKNRITVKNFKSISGIASDFKINGLIVSQLKEKYVFFSEFLLNKQFLYSISFDLILLKCFFIYLK